MDTAVHGPGRRACALLLACVFLFGAVPRSSAYSVLTHEQIVDFLWDTRIKRLLLERYPTASAEDLRHAHAYAYGGCLIQDMGYYPFGSKFFSDLVHYVRSGDFVSELIADSQNLNELAFALGALAHYAADNSGHPAVNAAVAKTFPKLRARFGDRVTYAEDPSAHIRTEFGFDVLQIAQQRYTSDAYHDFIGFQVAQPLLDRAFANTYGMELQDVLVDEEKAIETYRHALSHWIPELTRVALITKKKELRALPNFSPRKFRYLLSRTQYEKTWGRNYYRPRFGAKVLAIIVKILPKVGPLRALDIKPPTPETEKIYVKSVEETVKNYGQLLDQASQGQLNLPNRDFDTGAVTEASEYTRGDQTYAKLLKKLSEENFTRTPASLRANILEFYGDLNKPIDTKKHAQEWKDTIHSLDTLKGSL